MLYSKKPTTHGWESPGVNRFLEEANKEGIDLEVINPNDFEVIVTQDNRKSIFLDGKFQKLPDFLLTRLGSTSSYYGLAIIRHFENLGIPSFNSSISIENVRDKLRAQQILTQYNLPMPKSILVKFPVNIDFVERELGFPVIVKTVHGARGSGVFLSENKQNFTDLMQLIEATKPNVNIILQEYIKTSKGKDLRVFLVGGRVVALMQRIGKPGSFKANYSQGGGEVKAFPLNSEIEWLGQECVKILGLDYAGVDLLFDGNSFKICEVNASPGFKGLEKANPGLNIPKEVFNYIKLRLGK